MKKSDYFNYIITVNGKEGRLGIVVFLLMLFLGFSCLLNFSIVRGI